MVRSLLVLCLYVSNAALKTDTKFECEVDVEGSVDMMGSGDSRQVNDTMLAGGKEHRYCNSRPSTRRKPRGTANECSEETLHRAQLDLVATIDDHGKCTCTIEYCYDSDRNAETCTVLPDLDARLESAANSRPQCSACYCANL